MSCGFPTLLSSITAGLVCYYCAGGTLLFAQSWEIFQEPSAYTERRSGENVLEREVALTESLNSYTDIFP